MPSQSYKCNICGMIFVNSKELAKHQIDVHINEMCQCQACNKVFDNRQEFEKHAIQVHGSSSHYSSKSYSEDSDGSMNNVQDNNYNREAAADNYNLESKLLRQTSEEKARKRTRGSYRKSSKHFVITHS